MAPEKRSLGLTLFCWAEILIGIAGSILFVFSLDWSSVRSFYLISTHIENVYTVGVDFDMLALGFLYCAMTFPFVVILFLGVFSWQRRPWARKINIIVVPALAAGIGLFALVGLSLFGEAMKWRSFFIVMIPLCLFSIVKVWYLTRPRVKERFT